MIKLSERQKKRLELQNEILSRSYDPLDRFNVLDLGTEYGHTARAVKTRFTNASVHGVEIHKPTLKRCKELNGECYASLHEGDALEFLRKSSSGSWDVIIAAEIIEHFPKDKGILFLNRVKTQAKLAIVTTPIGFMAQGELHNNPHQVHQCGWDVEDFNIRGWHVYFTSKGISLGVYCYPRVKA